MASDLGKIGWIDLTVPDASELRDFYAAVVGWRSEGIEMGGYQDYCMLPAEGGAVAGVCHARGANEGLPAQWLIYVTVADLEQSLRQCRERGGHVLREPRGLGGQGRFAIIADPAGAVCALFQKP